MQRLVVLPLGCLPWPSMFWSAAPGQQLSCDLPPLVQPPRDVCWHLEDIVQGFQSCCEAAAGYLQLLAHVEPSRSVQVMLPADCLM